MRHLAAIFLSLLPLAASGQFSVLSNYYQYFGYGLTVGTNVSVVLPGTLRWSASETNLQVHDGSNWVAIGSGGGLSGVETGAGLLGDGTATNPLSIDPDVAVIQPLAERGDGAYLAWEGTNFVSVYGPRTALYASEALALHGATNLPGVLYPGQLIYMDVAAAGNRHAYIATNSLVPTNYANGDATWLPEGADDRYWRIFVREGETGAAGLLGLPGDDGMDGVGNLRYGVWDYDKPYVYDTATPVVVSYAGRWYDCVASSSGEPPTAGTNFWAVSVDKGLSGEIVGWTNLVFRGEWDSGEGGYAVNDAVYREGNLFVATNVPGIGQGPSVDSELVGADNARWHVLIKRGVRGLQGADGDEINSFTVYSLLPGTNTLFSGPPSSTNQMLRWVETYGGNLRMEWVGDARLGTNILSAAGGELLLNGVPYSSGQGITNISATNGLTGNGLDTELAVDWSQATTGKLSGVDWLDLGGGGGGATNIVGGSYDAGTRTLTGPAETDPGWTNYLATMFTNAVDARVSAIGVTGAVTSLDGLDGGITLVAGAGLSKEVNGQEIVFSDLNGAALSDPFILSGTNVVFSYTNWWIQSWVATSAASRISFAVKTNAAQAIGGMLYIQATTVPILWITNVPPVRKVGNVPSNAISAWRVESLAGTTNFIAERVR